MYDLMPNFLVLLVHEYMYVSHTIVAAEECSSRDVVSLTVSQHLLCWTQRNGTVQWSSALVKLCHLIPH